MGVESTGEGRVVYHVNHQAVKIVLKILLNVLTVKLQNSLMKPQTTAEIVQLRIRIIMEQHVLHVAPDVTSVIN